MRTLIISTCTLLCLAAGPALADEENFNREQTPTDGDGGVIAGATTDAPVDEKSVAAGYGIGGDWFKTADSDNDGVVDKSEHIMFLEKHFDNADQNGDGWLDATERQASDWSWADIESGQAFKGIADTDGKISRQDHHDAGMKIFGQWDADGDGQVSGIEFNARTGFRTQ